MLVVTVLVHNLFVCVDGFAFMCSLTRKRKEALLLRLAVLYASQTTVPVHCRLCKYGYGLMSYNLLDELLIYNRISSLSDILCM